MTPQSFHDTLNSEHAMAKWKQLIHMINKSNNYKTVELDHRSDSHKRLHLSPFQRKSGLLILSYTHPEKIG